MAHLSTQDNPLESAHNIGRDWAAGFPAALFGLSVDQSGVPTTSSLPVLTREPHWNRTR